MKQQVAYADSEQDVDKHEQGETGAEGGKVDAVTARVADGNHEDGSDIVCDGKSQDHHAERMRHLLSEDSHAAHDERDIGRSRNTPTMGGGMFSMRAQQQVDERGEQHAARCRYNRQAGGLRVPELTVGHFALDFESDVEEENRHHRVVDEPVQVCTANPAANRESERHVPEVMVRFWTQVRPQQGGNRHDDKDNAPGSLHLHQPFHRRDDFTDGSFREQIFYFIATRYFCRHGYLVFLGWVQPFST